jgi:hypothetical protein
VFECAVEQNPASGRGFLNGHAQIDDAHACVNDFYQRIGKFQGGSAGHNLPVRGFLWENRS